MHGLRSRATVLWLLLWFVGAAGAQGQEEAVAAYYRAVGEYFQVPTSEVAILAEGRASPEQVPVVLDISRRAGVSSDALLALRRGARTWADLAGRYGMSATTFYMPISEGAELGPLSAVYERFRSTPRSEWSQIRLDDAEIVALVNVRFLSDFLHVAPRQVLEVHRNAGSFVQTYQALLHTPGG